MGQLSIQKWEGITKYGTVTINVNGQVCHSTRVYKSLSFICDGVLCENKKTISLWIKYS